MKKNYLNVTVKRLFGLMALSAYLPMMAAGVTSPAEPVPYTDTAVGGCEYPILESPRCSNQNVAQVWLKNNAENYFSTVETASFITYDNGTATYYAVVSNGSDTVTVDLVFSGYTTVAPQDSPKENECTPHNTEDWVYWTTSEGTVTSEEHGTYTISRKGPAFQLGDGADVTRAGFGASGWFYMEGGDGYYTTGDINIQLGKCERLCTITVDAGADVSLCSGESVTLTAAVKDASRCASACDYTIEESAKCGTNGENIEEVWLENPIDNRFVTSSSSFVTKTDGTAAYSAVGSNGTDTVTVELTFSGYTVSPPMDSPKENWCTPHDTSDWVYYSTTTGTVVSELHGTFQVTRKGPAFQLGNGADVTRNGFGASGWLMLSGGDGYYENGDINVKLGDCTPIDFEETMEWVWMTEDGNIVGEANTPTITVDQSGTYKVVALDCADCEAMDTVTVSLSDPQTGMLTATDDRVCLDEEMIMISAQADGTAKVPADYIQGYVLTKGDALTVQALSDVPEFKVSEIGKYTIHTFVYPNTFDPATVIVFGQTTGFEVNALLRQGGGDICAVLDVAGAEINVTGTLLIGDYVWVDTDRDGIQDANENGRNAVTVSLFSCEGEAIDRTVTVTDSNGNDGYYSFEVCPGSYYIVFDDVPENYSFTEQSAGGDSLLDSNVNAQGTTDCFTVTDGDDVSIDAGLTTTCPQLEVQYKIRPRDTDGIYTPGNETAACLGDALIIRLVMPGDGVTYEDASLFTDWVFTYELVNGGVSVRGKAEEPLNNYVARYGLQENDFGTYRISWVSPDGCTGSDEFVLNFPDAGCNADGIRSNATNKVATVFPMPAKSGSTVQVIINTDTGSFASETTSGTALKAALPAKGEEVRLSLYELNSGRLVHRPRTVTISKGQDMVPYALDQLATGVYILKAEGNSWTDTKQLIVE